MNKKEVLYIEVHCPFMKKNGVSLFEIIVATMVLSITLLGLANIFVSVKRNIQHYRCKTVAAEYTKFFLEPLHMQVRQDTWLTNCLGPNHLFCFSGKMTDPDNNAFTFSPNFPPPIGLVNKVNVTVSWTEE